MIQVALPDLGATIYRLHPRQSRETLWMYKYARAAQLSPDGNTYAASMCLFESMGRILFVPIDRQRDVPALEHAVRLEPNANSISFSPDSRVLAARTRDGKLAFLHVKSKQVAETILIGKEHLAINARPLGLTFSSDGSHLAVEKGDGTFYVWSISALYKKLPRYERLSAECLEAVWKDLAVLDDDFPAPSPAVFQLLGAPDQALELIGRKLQPVALPDEAKVNQLIQQIKAGNPASREQATNELKAFDGAANAALRRAVGETKSAEGKRRLQEILDESESLLTAKHRQLDRCVDVLYCIRSEPAIALLNRFAAGAPDAFFTQLSARRLKTLTKGASEMKSP